MELHKPTVTTLLFSLLLSGAVLANTQPTHEDFIAAARDKYSASLVNKELIESLHQSVEDLNSKTPIEFGNDVFLTSSSITEKGLLTFRFLMKSSTRLQINPKLVSEALVKLSCTTDSIYRGIDAGLTAKALITTVDGFDVDSGLISKSTCAKYR